MESHQQGSSSSSRQQQHQQHRQHQQHSYQAASPMDHDSQQQRQQHQMQLPFTQPPNHHAFSIPQSDPYFQQQPHLQQYNPQHHQFVSNQNPHPYVTTHGNLMPQHAPYSLVSQGVPVQHGMYYHNPDTQANRSSPVQAHGRIVQMMHPGGSQHMQSAGPSSSTTPDYSGSVSPYGVHPSAQHPPLQTAKPRKRKQVKKPVDASASSSASPAGPSTALSDVTTAANNNQNKQNGSTAASKSTSKARKNKDSSGPLPHHKCEECGKEYTGHHARSIYRRHLSDKHGVALKDQPRRTRWDGDVNRPKNDEERRQRTLHSKRKWARMRRAKDKEAARLAAASCSRSPVPQDKADGAGIDEDGETMDTPSTIDAMGTSSSSPSRSSSMHPPGFVPSVLVKQEGATHAPSVLSSSSSAPPPDSFKGPKLSSPPIRPQPSLMMPLNTSTSTPLRSKISLTMPAPNFTISKEKTYSHLDTGLSTPVPTAKTFSWTMPESAKRLGGSTSTINHDLFFTTMTSSDRTPILPPASTPSRWSENIPGMGNSPLTVSRYLGSSGSSGSSMGGPGSLGASLLGTSPSSMFSLDHLKPSPRDRSVRGTPQSLLANASPTRATAAARRGRGRSGHHVYDHDDDSDRERDLPPLLAGTPTKEYTDDDKDDVGMLWR